MILEKDFTITEKIIVNDSDHSRCELKCPYLNTYDFIGTNWCSFYNMKVDKVDMNRCDECIQGFGI